MVIAIVATIYTLFLLYAAGWDHLLLSCILYAPAAILYWMARRERNLRVFTPAEAVLFLVIVAGAVAGTAGIAGSVEEGVTGPRSSGWADSVGLARRCRNATPPPGGREAAAWSGGGAEATTVLRALDKHSSIA